MVAFSLAIGFGWLVYKLCELVLIPLCSASLEGLVEVCGTAFELLALLCVAFERWVRAWWRKVTARWRIRRIERQTLRAMDAAYREHTEGFEALVTALDETEHPTADRTAGVRPGVRSAVRRWFGV